MASPASTAAGPCVSTPASLAPAPIPVEGVLRQRICVDVRVGDGESRSAARSAALDDIRQRALAAVGVLTETRSVVIDGSLSEQARSMSVALVRISDVVDGFHLDEHGAPMLSVAATCEITAEDQRQLVKTWEAVKLRALDLDRSLLDRSRLAPPPTATRSNRPVREELQPPQPKREMQSPLVAGPGPTSSEEVLALREELARLTSQLEYLDRPSLNPGSNMLAHRQTMWQIDRVRLKLHALTQQDEARRAAVQEAF